MGLIYKTVRLTGSQGEREVKIGFVILEDVVIGVCDKCGNRYYSAETLSRVDAVASGKVPPGRTEQVPVADAGEEVSRPI